MEHKDPVITCDYCGAKVDTSIHSTCPNCGGTYEKDEEWKRRHSPNLKWAEENAEEVSEEKVEDARKKSKRTLNKFRLAFILLIVFPILIIRSVLKRYESLSGMNFRTDENPTEYSYENYERASYAVTGNNVIFDDGKVKVSLTGFYERKDYSLDCFGEEVGIAKAEFRVENRSGTDVFIRMRCGGVNGVIADYGTGDFYGSFKNESAVTVYEPIRYVRGGAVKEVIYGDIRVTDYKDYTCSQSDYVRYGTDAESDFEKMKPIGTLKYEGNGIRIYTGESPDPYHRENGYVIQIFNDSGTNFSVTATEEGYSNEVEGSQIYQSPLPNDYVLARGRMKSANPEKEPSTFRLSVTFSSPEDPSKDFSTGYFSIKP